MDKDSQEGGKDEEETQQQQQTMRAAKTWGKSKPLLPTKAEAATAQTKTCKYKKGRRPIRQRPGDKDKTQGLEVDKDGQRQRRARTRTAAAATSFVLQYFNK